MKDISMLIARILLSLIFLLSFFGKLSDFAGTKAYMGSKGMPEPGLFLVAAMILLALGGLSVLLGLRAKIGALLLMAFLLPASLIFHDFWNANADQVDMQRIQFLKNLAILGGLFMVFANGAGKYSISKWKEEA